MPGARRYTDPMGAVDRLPPPVKRHRLKADDYQRLGALGVLPPDARVELLDGELIEMAPIGSRCWAIVNRLARLLQHAVGERAIVSSQSSFRLDTHSEPQPDLALFKPRDDFYAAALPTPDDTLLVIEVADSSCRCTRAAACPRSGSSTSKPGCCACTAIRAATITSRSPQRPPRASPRSPRCPVSRST